MKRLRIKASDHGKLFRRALQRKLITPRGGSPRNPKIYGGVLHEGGQSDIMVFNHADPLRSTPWVDCKESWTRRDVDWHFLDLQRKHGFTAFCWVLDLEWQDHFNQRLENGESPSVLCEDAAHWLVEAMSLMLSRHWIGWEHGLDHWPREWEDYSHGEAGVEEYKEGRCRAA